MSQSYNVVIDRIVPVKWHQMLKLVSLFMLLSVSIKSSAQQVDTITDHPLEASAGAPVLEPALAQDAEASETDETAGLEPQNNLILTEAFAQKITKDGSMLDHGAIASGDRVQIGVRVRNAGGRTLRHTIVTQPLPESLVYLGVRPISNRNNAQTTALFSVDQGRFFATLDRLKIKREDGVEYPASPADVSHIRWVLGYKLRPRQSTLLSFQAIVR